jgi:hypothetical protein
MVTINNEGKIAFTLNKIKNSKNKQKIKIFIINI